MTFRLCWPDAYDQLKTIQNTAIEALFYFPSYLLVYRY